MGLGEVFPPRDRRLGFGVPEHLIRVDAREVENWSHDYAERIAPDGGIARRVWLLTRYGSFRQFDDVDNDGLYEKVSPEDEYRTLTKVGVGWQLRDLEGTMDVFDSSGLWQSRTDRHGNAKIATYSAGRLASVTMPDGRSETFAYDPTTSKLATITEVGIGGASQRVWRYAWSAESRVWRPAASSTSRPQPASTPRASR